MKKEKVMNGLNAYLKRKMMFARILGILACLVALTGIVIRYLNLFNSWLCLILISYCLGIIFTFNSNLQNLRVGNPWQKINSFCAVIMYILVAFLIIYGFIEGILQTQF